MKNGRYRVYVNHQMTDVKESSISNVFSSISDCFNIEDSSISAFKTYTNIEALCFNIEGASILILAGPARAGLQQLQAAVQLRWYSVLIAGRICLLPGEAAQRWGKRNGSFNGRGGAGGGGRRRRAAAAACAKSASAAPAAAAAAPATRKTLCK